MLKKCSKCKQELPLNEFHKNKYRNDGLQGNCKNCRSEYDKIYNATPERKCHLKTYNQSPARKAYNKSPERLAYQKTYNKIYNATPERRAYMKNYEKSPKRQIYKQFYVRTATSKIAQQNYYTNPERKTQRAAGVREKYNTNIQFRLTVNLRSRLSAVISHNYKNGSAVRDLGCSTSEFKTYLESQFTPEMTWDNYGKGKLWELDHIVPLATFDLTDKDQFVEACHYTNIRPLERQVNQSRGGMKTDICDTHVV